jgi:hypothetical protein
VLDVGRCTNIIQDSTKNRELINLPVKKLGSNTLIKSIHDACWREGAHETLKGWQISTRIFKALKWKGYSMPE